MCVQENKIPVLELRFIKLQRDKVGSCVHYHIGGVDIKESTSKRRRKEEYCQELEKRAKTFKIKGDQSKKVWMIIIA